MSTNRQKSPIRKLTFLLPAMVCIFSAMLTAQSQESTGISKEEKAAQIKAELTTLNERLAELELQAAKKEEQLIPDGISRQEWMETKTQNPAALTETSRRLTPAATTTITREEIRRSQARSLYELLEMYVPGLQMLFASDQPKTMGMRGMIAQRSDKYLLLVNGQVMNERLDSGATTEFDLPMLSDIHHIDVIRGPAASIYGPGAESMVINVVVDNAMTYQGQEAVIRGGSIEQYAVAEYKLGKKLDNDRGVFFYAGISQYDGADPSDSPTVFGSKESMWLREGHYPYVWKEYQGTDYIRSWFKNLNEMPFDLPRMKMHGEYTHGNFNIWGRYTQGGQWIDFTRWWGTERETSDEGIVYTQASIQANYDQEVSSDFSIKYTAGYTRLTNDNENYERAFYWKSFAEDEIYGKIKATWNLHENHTLAFGGEWSHQEYGKRFADTPISIQPFGKFQAWGALYVPRYNINQRSLLGEYQWKINDQFTWFFNGRLDWTNYTKMMFSPRGVLVWSPTEKDTVKFIASRSEHTNTAGQMWIDYNLFNIYSPTEKLHALELRYERQHSDAFWFAGSFFLHDLENAFAENPDENVGSGGTSSQIIGDVKSWGLELEASYHKDKLKVDFSHTYTKLIDTTDAGIWDWSNTVTWWNWYSAEPFGFGDDFAQLHNHVTKLRAEYGLTDKLTVNGALCVLWGSPGGQDWANYRNHVFANWDYDVNFKEPFSSSAYLNLGAEYRWSKNTTFYLTGYNLLGLIDKDLNKRRVGFDEQLPGHYRVQPVSVGASLRHKF